MINELKLIDNIDVLHENKIVLYGAGAIGVKALKILKETGMPAAAYFCDGDPRKWGTFVEGVEVLSLSELKQLDESENLAIIIASEYVPFLNQITEDIAWLKLRTDNIFTLFGLTVSLVRNDKASGLNGGHYDTISRVSSDIYNMGIWVNRLKQYIKWAVNTNVVMVYSSQKTGSITVANSLHEINILADHFHLLTGIEAAKMLPNHVYEELFAWYVKERLDLLKTRKSVKIIIIVREPVGRNLSQIFSESRNYRFRLSHTLPCEPFINSVAESLVLRKMFTMDSLNWFDNELKVTLDIDVYAHPFDREKGYSIIKHGNAEALVMKLEKLNSLERVIAEFVGVPRFKLVNANEGDNKMYKYLYKQVKEAIRIPREVFDFYYKDPRLAHFYSEEEIAGFWKKWENNIAD